MRGLPPVLHCTGKLREGIGGILSRLAVKCVGRLCDCPLRGVRLGSMLGMAASALS